MATASSLLESRATSGARYLAAIVELRSAYIELASIDRALGSMSIANPVPSFRGDFDQIPPELQHPDYAAGHRPGIVKDVMAAADVLLAT